MKTVYIDDLRQPLAPCVATIGFFDGVHLGHRHLIDFVVQRAHEQGLEAVAVTFDRHPREVLGSDYRPRLLTTLTEKLRLLEQTGLDHVAVLHFTPSLAALSAQDFMRQVLGGKLSVRRLIIGYDNRFGHNRSEGFRDYQRYGREMGMEVERCGNLLMGGWPVSSTLVRQYVSEGNMEAAAKGLGRNFMLEGRVVHGRQEGRQMGFPTANIATAERNLLLPRNGVYAVRVRQEGEKDEWQGMMNIGHRPTFDNGEVSVEVNIFAPVGDLYGKVLRVEVVHRLRDERPFSSEEELMKQLETDKENVVSN